SAPREEGQVRADIVDMRRRLLAEFGRGGPWNIKHVSGGLVDVEFIAQGLQLLAAHRHPEALDQNTLAALEKLAAAGVLPRPRAERLRAAGDLYLRLTQIIRLCVGKEFYAESAPLDLARLIARAAGTPDMAAAESLLAD